MKKVLSIAIALCMMLTLSVCAFADDTVVLNLDQEDAYIFWSNGNWETGEFTDYAMTDFIAALQTEGAQLVITRGTESHIEHNGGETYEKFLITNSWYSGADVTTGNTWVALGTAGHNSTTEPDVGIIDCISDDGITIVYDANTIAQALVDGGFDVEGTTVLFISNSLPAGSYKISNISVILPESAAAEETTDEADASSDVEETTEAVESTETSTASSPDTGVALALVPMAIAGIAVVSSKRR
ncbi:MAG: hypothetical protein LUG49_06345 [Oscillospiraceae bacterium]|nr:hypothetical protein [Oscillospiraceae bacterium]